MSGDRALLLLVVVGVTVAALCRWRGIAPALPLVAAGLAVSYLPATAIQLPDPDVALGVILPPLVFAAAQNASFVDLRRFSRPIIGLAVLLVVVTTFAVGAVAVALVPVMPFAVACALGAVLAPTDTVAASAAARSSGLDPDVRTVIEGESLINDATALTAFKVASLAIIAGSVTVLDVAVDFSLAVISGVVVGAVAGYGLAAVIKWVPDASAVTAAVLIAPFGVYSLAEELQGSGFLAVVITGVWVAHASTTAGSYDARLRNASIWAEVNFILEAIAFLYVGVEFRDVVSRMNQDNGGRVLFLILVILALLVVVRILFVSATMLLRRVGLHRAAPWGRRQAVVIAWAGARGPISVFAVLGLPLVVPDFQRNLVFVITFGVVVGTLVLSLTLSPLIRRLDVAGGDDVDVIRSGRAVAARAAQECLEVLLNRAMEDESVTEETAEHLRAEAGQRIEQTRMRRQRGIEDDERDTIRIIRTEMLDAERAALLRLRDSGRLPDRLMRTLLLEVDEREALWTRRR